MLSSRLDHLVLTGAGAGLTVQTPKKSRMWGLNNTITQCSRCDHINSDQTGKTGLHTDESEPPRAGPGMLVVLNKNEAQGLLGLRTTINKRVTVIPGGPGLAAPTADIVVRACTELSYSRRRDLNLSAEAAA